MNPPQINVRRLWDSLMDHARIGATPEGGVCRETLTDLDRQGRDLFAQWSRQAGMDVAIDELGNMYASRPGTDPSLPSVAIGSHLDTQPTGGKFDGVLGVLAGLEAVRSLNDANRSTLRTITVVNWTNEEGSRFYPSMAASGVYGGVFSRADVDSWVDRQGITFRDALDRIGYRGTEPTGARRFAAYLELHIEQGPILDSERLQIGVVTGVQAMSFNEVVIRGEERHAGTTPMELRCDPVAAFVRTAANCFRLGNEMPDARVTIGHVEAKPGSHSTIPFEISFALDLRHPDPDRLAELLACFECSAEAERERGFSVVRSEFGAVDAFDFDAACIEAIRNAATEAGYSHADMITGAGHDAVYVARACPVGMIFIPCRGGISHSPKEDINPEEAAAGADVLLRAAITLADRA